MTQVSCKKNQIIQEFQLLIDHVRNAKEKHYQFKIKQYNNVISYLKMHPDSITNTTQVLEILRNNGMKLPNETPPNWNSSTLKKIDKIIKEGSLGMVIDEKTTVLKTLTGIPGIGPSKAKELYEKNIRNLEDLRKQPDLINKKQQIGLRHYPDLKQKIPRSEMTIWENTLKAIVNKILQEKYPEIDILFMELAGSYRRGKLESGDIDFYLALSHSPPKLMKEIARQLVEEKFIICNTEFNDFFSLGAKKLMAVAKLGQGNIARHLDMFIYPKSQAPFALLYATGSGEFNVKMRNYAIKQGYSLSDKALLVGNTKGEPPSSQLIQEKIGKPEIETELDIFKFLGLEYVEPPNRLPTILLKTI